MAAHVVANWIGYTVQVQNESQAQVDDHHFNRFDELQGSKVAQYSGAQSGREMQKGAQKDGKNERFSVWA